MRGRKNYWQEELKELGGHNIVNITHVYNEITKNYDRVSENVKENKAKIMEKPWIMTQR